MITNVVLLLIRNGAEFIVNYVMYVKCDNQEEECSPLYEDWHRMR